MKKLLLSAVLMSTAIGFSQNLVLNGTADELTNTSDNSDAFDMTPNSTIVDNTGTTIDSPYRALWSNPELDQYIDDTYFVSTTDKTSADEAPGSSSDGTYDGATKTRALKISEDGDDNPTVSGSTRRLYQKIEVTAGNNYTFSLDSRSEAENINTEVFMLNEEITTEVGLETGALDSRVDAYLEITNDFNSSKGSETNNTFTNNSLPFTASGNFVVIYIRSLSSVDKLTEVFYDNISLIEDAPLSNNDFTIDGQELAVYPTPIANEINISSGKIDVTGVTLYSLSGNVVATAANTEDALNVDNLSAGAYLLQIESGGKIASTIVVKQ